MKTLLVSAVALIDVDGRVLLAQRPEGKSLAGLWEFPGGKLEQGESPEQALKREFLEETALELLNSQELMLVEHNYPDRHVRLHVRISDSFNGEVMELEGQTLRWAEVSELDELDFLEGNHVILDALKTIKRPI